MEEKKQYRKSKARPIGGRGLVGSRVRASIIRDRCDLSRILRATDEEDALSIFLEGTTEVKSPAEANH